MNHEAAEIIKFVNLTTSLGGHYLASGGPTSRLEELITLAGGNLGFETNVFATPTGIFVCCQTADSSPVTKVSRLSKSGINLMRLPQLEIILSELARKNINLTEAQNKFEKLLNSHQLEYAEWLLPLATLVIGFASSYTRFEDFWGASVSGFITTIIFSLQLTLSRKLPQSAVLTDFLGCLLALFLSLVIGNQISRPLEMLAVGSFVYLVPGITLTTAISDLAEQNYVAGTAKFMKAFLTFMSMTLAYLLSLELGSLLPWKHISILSSFPAAGTSDLSFWLSMVCAILMTVGFSILFNVPKFTLLLAVLCGLASWLVLRLTEKYHLNLLNSFCASFSVGLLSLMFSRILKVPSQLFSVPGILALLPGMLAFVSVSQIFTGEQSGSSTVFKMLMLATSIVFGLFLARMPFILVSRFSITALKLNSR